MRSAGSRRRDIWVRRTAERQPRARWLWLNGHRAPDWRSVIFLEKPFSIFPDHALSLHVGIAAKRITRLPHGGDAIRIAQRGEFVGVAIAGCRARKGILRSRMQVDFDHAGRQPA